MERFDIAIIGTGPAGLEAAITATVRNKSVLLLGSDLLSQKLQKAHRIDNYLGFASISGEDLAQRFKEHLDNLDISVTPDRITGVYAMGDYFALQGSPQIYEASSLILATGVVHAKMLDGEQDLLGRGVSYCATCDAALYRNKDVIVVGYGKQEESEVSFLSELAAHVLYVPQYLFDETTQLGPNVEVRPSKPVCVSRDDSSMDMVLICEDGQFKADGIFILRDAVPANQMLMGIQTDGAHIVVNKKMETNIAGCFACGDITGKPYQYIKSAGEGNVAALSAVDYLSSLQ